MTARKRNRSSAKAAGKKFERDIAEYLALRIDDRIARRHSGDAEDTGDIAGVRVHGQHMVIECKNRSEWKPGTWLRQAENERINDEALACAVFAKRHGIADPGQQVVLMTLADFVALVTGVRPDNHIEEDTK